MNHKTLAKHIAKISQRLFDVAESGDTTRPDPEFGDFASNVALKLSKKLARNPRDVAETIAAQLGDVPELVQVTVAGPGFINIRLSDAALSAQLAEPFSLTLIGKKYLVEYSDPNPFKPLHAGHLYTTLVGDAISRLLEQAGAEVVRLNYGGDVGLHVGRTMWGIIHYFGGEYPDRLPTIPADERPQWLGARYVEGTTAYDQDETARAEIVAINKRVYELHAVDDHDSAFAQLYWTCRQWSYEYFARLYEQLGVKPFDRFIPESEVSPLGLRTVTEQLAKGIYKESQGAVVFEGEPHGLHTRVFVTSEGLPTYEAKDIGLAQIKWDDYHFDRSIVITANEQAQYYEVMLKSLEQFAPEIAARSIHLTHGIVKLKGGVKISSRKGNGPSALDIIESARQAAQQQDRATNEGMILAAIKYAFAKNRVGGDIIYDVNTSIALEGNSGPYLQYAHARARSILAKVPARDEPIAPVQFTADERQLALKLSQYNEVVERAVTELMPHYLCTYLYELAQAFNRFYEKNRVIGDPRQAMRVWLVAIYAERLRSGLDLLGINAPDHM